MPLGRRPLLLLLNGAIHTMNPDQPRATALAVDRVSGQILAVGDDAEIRSLAGPLTDTLDLGGRTVIPGMIDAHTHLVHYARARLDVDLRGAADEDEAVARVVERAARMPKGTWIRGRGWDANHWPGQRFPTRASLDAAVSEHPVALSDHSYHSMWVNSAALRIAGVTAQTPQPGEGRIGHDVNGEPDGMLYEDGAMAHIFAVLQEYDDEALLGELRLILAEMRSRGLTGVHNIEDAHSLRLLQRLHAADELNPRVLLYIPRHALPDAVRLGLRAGFGDDALRFAGVKLFMDGALGPHTAAMNEPYEGEPGNRGLLNLSDDETARLVREANNGGIGVAIHAIGDRAVHTALDGIEKTLRENGGATEAATGTSPRFRLEHVQLAAESDIQRMARLGVIASVQPFHAVVDRDAAERFWGARHRRAYAYQTMRAAGVSLALGSDVPVDTCDPLRILHAAIQRRDDQTPERSSWLPEQALTLTQALWGYTVGAAYAGGQEARQGSLEVGKLADLVVLDADPFTTPTEHLAGATVAATLVGGNLVYGALE
jgi:hypothetical protein